MMKSVQSAALSLTMMTMMMMMMMMMISVSAGPLPPSLNSDDMNSDRKTNSSRFESHHHGNNTESNFTRDINTNITTNNDMMNSTLKNTINVSANNVMSNVMNTMNITTNDTMNDMMNNTMEDRTNITGVSTFVFVLPMEKVVSPVMYSPQCVLPTCLTANLGSSLQSGDETAGGATTDPFGVGKK
ncbi:5'-AMP-activated serine/threonine-protein kinase catalytic subunit alpha isoform X3 [Epinephelus fuscoguttatus]|uniref:5'-AMP-activated serine/threonine-protein kinase catalytic subunit alpha isoform X3 n=1 Tax=Epinephelus fuscoguttatus TaxID=293821 RepID=UPI0020D0300A|nr:5'-AMP-activated serine/threonine-protein kinase catalytic subunit alpha isoform X3 [Epinephelus fuscoguttatus]